jgi:hypothetical protein
MTTDQKHTAEGPDLKQGSQGEGADFPPETEAAKQGGVGPAQRQAERDWQHSSKESGE